jgi:hypothetical protein
MKKTTPTKDILSFVALSLLGLLAALLMAHWLPIPPSDYHQLIQ